MKQAVILVMLFLISAFLYAQVEIDPREGFANVRESSNTKDLDIQIKAMMPDISVVQLKSDTYLEPGNYKYTINLEVIQAESKIQLTNWQNEINNWLEESK